MTSSSPPQQELTVGEAMRLALGHEQAGRLAEAGQLAAAVLGAVPGHADALALLGALRLRRGEAAAGALLAESVRQAGADAPFFANLGSLLRRAGAMTAALAAQERALALDPAFGVVWFNLANARREAGERAGAIAAYRRAAVLLVRHPEPCRRLAELLLESGEPAAALAEASRAATLEPLSAEVLVTQGNALRALGRLGEAAAFHRTAVALRPDFTEAHANLGAVLTEAQAAGGLTALSRAVRLRPADGTLRRSLGEALALAGDPRAVAALRTALAFEPSGARVLEKLVGAAFDAPGARPESPGAEGRLAAWHRRAAALSGQTATTLAALRIVPAKDWASAAGQPYATVCPARPLAVETGTDRWGRVAWTLPEAFVTRVDEALVHPGNFAVETPDGALLLDGLHAYSRSSLELLPHIVRHTPDDRVLRALPDSVHRVEEEAVLLGGCANFTHGLLDWASRLTVLAERPELGGLPVLVSAAVRPAILELFGLLGLAPERLRTVPAGVVLSCRRLWVPSLTHAFQDMAPEHLAFLRRRTVGALGLEAVPRTRRLYLTRRGAAYRTLVNEAEIEALLAAEGFERFVPDGLSLAGQIAAFAHAEAVVVPVGGGSGAVAFAAPGTRVLELTHSHIVLPQFAVLCSLLGQPYGQIVGEPVRNRGNLAFDWDFRIEPEFLAKGLQALGKP